MKGNYLALIVSKPKKPRLELDCVGTLLEQIERQSLLASGVDASDKSAGELLDHLPDSNQIRGIFFENNVVDIAVSFRR